MKRFVVCRDYYGSVVPGTWKDQEKYYEMTDGDCLTEEQLVWADPVYLSDEEILIHLKQSFSLPNVLGVLLGASREVYIGAQKLPVISTGFVKQVFADRFRIEERKPEF